MERLQFDFNRYPYLTPELPGLGGAIRQQWRDFQVDEVPAYTPSGEGEHLYLFIEKEGLTTREIFLFLRDRMGIPEKDIGVAGLKDKHALTRQWFSLPNKYEHRLETFDTLKGAKVIKTGIHSNKLRVGHLRGNRFRILIRQPEPGLEVARGIFQRLQQLGVPNYYGPQRFGIGGLNPVKGYDLIQKGKGRNDPWLGRFLIGSVQSLLFNDWLALRLQEGLFNQVIQGDVVKKHDTGGEFVVEDAQAENPRALRFEISATGALFGKRYREAQGEARALEDRILANYQLSREQFAARRGDRRLIRFPLPEWAVAQAPEGIWVSFFLPKGAYATSVLREVMKNPETEVLETENEEGES